METGFEFQYPWALLLLALLPLYSWLRGRIGKSSALLYPDITLLDGISRPVREKAGRLRPFLRLATAAALIIAIAGPRTANKEIERETEGLDIMLVVDLSWSMMALDMSTERNEVTRWQASQNVIFEFIHKRPDDRIGAVVFSGKPYLLSPLTINKVWVEKGIDRMHIGIIQETGTAIGEAVAMAVDRMKNVKGKNSKVIILLTDGDNNKGQIDPFPAAQLAAAMGAKIYTIGIGMEKPCYLPAFDPSTGKLKLDANGHIIPTLLLQPANYAVLGKMAELSHGRFYRATNRRELLTIYSQIDQLEKTEVKLKRYATYDLLFQWPLLAALAALAWELLLSNTLYRRVP